jgi:VanZ family protein
MAVLRVVRVFSWFCVLALAVGSLTPGEEMIRSGLPRGYEHVAAYFIAAVVFALAYRKKKAILIGSALITYAVLLEISQLFIHGRHSRFVDFAASTLGVVLGLTVGLILKLGSSRLERQAVNAGSARKQGKTHASTKWARTLPRVATLRSDRRRLLLRHKSPAGTPTPWGGQPQIQPAIHRATRTGSRTSHLAGPSRSLTEVPVTAWSALRDEVARRRQESVRERWSYHGSRL